MGISSFKPLAVAIAACLLLAACGLGQAKVVVTPGVDGTYALAASKRADYAAINYQTIFLEQSAQLAVENGYQYFEIERGEINSSASRTQRSVSWQIRLHNDAEFAQTSLMSYRAAEVLNYGPRQESFWIKNAPPQAVN